MSQDATFKNYVLNYYSKTEKTYLEYAIDECSIKTVEVLAKNKAILGYKNKYTKEILNLYIENLGCYLEKNADKCLIPAFVLLIENDYFRLRPTLLEKLNCYSDVLLDWYIVIQPVVKALIKKGLKVEKSIINITGEKNNYLLEVCKRENQYTNEENKEHQKAIRNYIQFLKQEVVDFETEIDGKRPINLLSSVFQKKIRGK
ncbi:hypothetical protein ACE193_13300 [Bernardetia sp. OM2101]|uniref:hypothetical protein n=1 Tax=Bernardetia sp. OM2101 TaxID=3344876 RepID=UPI0035CF087E